ncbi:hypothetical protein BH20PSE1_BH20PSE1_03970 [soil metagenome]
MADRTSWDDFMLKEYEEAWTYLRYSYDMSNRMLGYVFAIIVIVGFVIGRLQSPGGSHSGLFPNPSTIDPAEGNLLSFIFLVLFLGGLCLHGFFVFQRVIVDRQLQVIDRIRQYFIDQAKDTVDLEPYLYFRAVPVRRGAGDPIAQTRLMLPAFVNGITGTLAVMYFLHRGWDFSFITSIFVVLLVLQFLLINQWAYTAIARRVAPKQE